MPDAFDKAESWRSRADELRRLAEDAREPIARDSLRDMAGAADHHARTLEAAAITFRSISSQARRLRARVARRCSGE